MRKFILISLVLASMVMTGYEPVYYEYTPVFMSRSDLESAIRFDTPRELKKTGKIYILDQYVFINEKYKGFHVFDNSNPSAPQNIGFIQIDGCLDVAIRGSVMYADNAVDLIAIQLNLINKTATVQGRVRNALPEPSSPQGFWQTRAFEKYRPKNGIIVRWELNNGK
jgi:hypothetical protein